MHILQQTVDIILSINAQQRADCKGLRLEENGKKLGHDLEKIKN